MKKIRRGRFFFFLLEYDNSYLWYILKNIFPHTEMRNCFIKNEGYSGDVYIKKYISTYGNEKKIYKKMKVIAGIC